MNSDRNCLVWNAIPTVFDVPNTLQTTGTKRKLPFHHVVPVKKSVVTATVSAPDSDITATDSSEESLADHSYTATASSDVSLTETVITAIDTNHESLVESVTASTMSTDKSLADHSYATQPSCSSTHFRFRDNDGSRKFEGIVLAKVSFYGTILQSNLLKHRWWFSCSSMKQLVE